MKKCARVPWSSALTVGILVAFILPLGAQRAVAERFDAAPFSLSSGTGNELVWEDPREVHEVVVQFKGAPPDPSRVRIEYWGSWWPERHLPKDREPGGGDIGWMELGNWYKYGWRKADAQGTVDGQSLRFRFAPINQHEFPSVKEYPATFRYTLKLRVVCEDATPAIDQIRVLTDSETATRTVRLVYAQPQASAPVAEAFNGSVKPLEKVGTQTFRLELQATANPDPNTFDRTLVSVGLGSPGAFTFRVNDLDARPIWLPHLGVAITDGSDDRDYQAISSALKSAGSKTIYDRVTEHTEQSWVGAWEGVPRKKSRIYFPMGLDGGRQRFRLNADGSLLFRSNDHYLKARPGQDTPRLELEKSPVGLELGLSTAPVDRTLQEECLPICITTWDTNGVRIQATALVTELNGTQAAGKKPEPDSSAVFLARFVVTNLTDSTRTTSLPLNFTAGAQPEPVRADAEGVLWRGDEVRGQVVATGAAVLGSPKLTWMWELAPGESETLVLKVPYVLLQTPEERDALRCLDFDRERTAVAGYWRRQLDRSARLVTPEPTLNEFYRSHAMHLLINCESEPGSNRRFARVGSFDYGAYGNESCMMVVDLDRRGLHQEAQECLDAWLHYQSTVELPGSFASKEGVLYGAGGYESGGYNQHHGWILWMMAEHYRFTRDRPWLEQSASGLVKACDWIINETARTADRHPLERGLLPAGSLEDIGDWWTWLSTSCYTWRGLDAAAWALGEIQHPDAARLRRAAAEYHQHLLANFHAAAERSPVVRLRDGTAIPHIPSHVHRRGRCFGWICETLEGALHLIITRAIDPNSQEASWIVQDYEDNLYLSNQYGYTLDDFEQHWFGRGGMSMQACLLLDVDAYLYRDDVKHALRSLFNGQAVSYFPDVRMNTEHALPDMADWRGDQFKSSDESNTTGWLRSLFLREEGDQLWVGQAIPRSWLKDGQHCGVERAATYFGPTSILYTVGAGEITAQLEGPQRNPPAMIRLRIREPEGRALASVTVNDQAWSKFKGEWIELPGNIGSATIKARF